MDAEAPPPSRAGANGTSGAGREVEVTRPLALDERESHLIEMHSVYNVLNVAIFRIDAVGYLVGDAKTADELMDQVLGWHAGLIDRERSLAELGRVPEMREKLLAWMEAQRGRVGDSGRAELEQHIGNIASIFGVLETRVAELVRRTTSGEGWVVLPLRHIRANLEAAFRAIELNAFGRWRIAFSREEQAPGDYLMEIDLGSDDGETISIPAVLEDSARDLAANARKFTEPGGRIGVTLREERDEVFLEVSDTGRGIPPEEIEEVVRFGVRGSNQGSLSHPGGGFGLTKACHVARSFGGRMWIRSSPGEGTTVTIRLPRPR